MRESPRSRFIVTSRAPLHIAGERELHLGPVTDAAVTIFTDRARAVRPGWEPGADEPVVVEICALLDDLPLGIELAAARIGKLPPAVIRDRLTARLPLPGPGVRDVPSRQQTLDAAVAWSHDLLEPRLQRLLHELAVFDGSFDVEQVDAMSASAGDATDRLDDVLELADRSLVVPVSDPGGRARFRLLRTIQTYALGRLAIDGDESDDPSSTRGGIPRAPRRSGARARHLATPGRPRSRRTGHPQPAGGAALGDRPRRRRDRPSSRGATVALLECVRPGRRGPATDRGGTGTPERRRSHAPARAWAASALGSLAYWQADPATARIWYQQQIDLATAVGDEACVADGMFNIGHVLFIDPRGRATPARPHRGGGPGGIRELGDPRARGPRLLGTRDPGDERRPTGRGGQRTCVEPSPRPNGSTTANTTRCPSRASAGRHSPWATSPTAISPGDRGTRRVPCDARHRDDDDLAAHRRAGCARWSAASRTPRS